MMPEKQQPKQE